jgi:hypothetical protein
MRFMKLGDPENTLDEKGRERFLFSEAGLRIIQEMKMGNLLRKSSDLLMFYSRLFLDLDESERSL